MHPSLVRRAKHAVPLHAVTQKGLKAWTAKRGKREQHWLSSAGFAAKSGELLPIPDAGGAVSAYVLGLGKGGDPLAAAVFSEQLEAGTYRLGDMPDDVAAGAALAWILGLYHFTRYKKNDRAQPKLLLPDAVDGEDATRIAEGVFLARDLITTPANDMGPVELAAAAQNLAKRHKAKFAVTIGDALLKANYPLIHTVGRASVRPPRLIDIRWGRTTAPKVTLVGKGVCFDSGGLDIKGAAGMQMMKKDMGGAATVLGLAHMIMDSKLDVRLRVLIPAVENSVSGSAYRPGDVIPSRKGLKIEIGNTDAEGRLVLADALTEADTETPELLIDIATLTGAARAATGFELPPYFTDDEKLASDLQRVAFAVHDPMWRLPLWRGYESAIASPIADLNNSPDYNLGGAITAALFLNRFVDKAKSWVHLDIPAWIDRPKPGRRKGAEPNTARALYALLKERYGKA